MSAEHSLETPRNTLILVFCLFITGLSFLQNLSAKALSASLEPIYEKTIYPLGMWQGWTMFTSNQSDVLAIRDTYVYQDGSIAYASSPFGQKPRYVPVVEGNLSPSLYYFDPSGGYRTGYLAYMCKHPEVDVAKPLAEVRFEVAKGMVPLLGQDNPQDLFVQPLEFTTITTVKCSAD